MIAPSAGVVAVGIGLGGVATVPWRAREAEATLKGKRLDEAAAESAAEAAFCNALTNNKDGFTSLLAVVAPNLPCKPNTVMFNKVTMKGAKQAVQMFGPAQRAVSMAVMDCVEDGTIPANEADDIFICVGVFIHWEAKDDTKIYQYNYDATKLAGETYCAGYAELYDLESTILRFGIPYGPRARAAGVVAKFTDLAFEGKALTIAGDGAVRALTGAPPTSAYIAAHAAMRLDGASGYAAERAWQARLEGFGDSTDLCSLVNAKSGGCAEDCGFCAQSRFAEAETPLHAMMEPEQMLEHAKAAEAADPG